MEKGRLPNFFIVGAAKAGTTSLYYYLKQHPEIFMSPVKEPNFFCYHEAIEVINFFRFKEDDISTLDDYLALFRKVNKEKAIGEASTQYLFFPSTAHNIKKMIPHAKMIILLRDPVSRAFSSYLFHLKGNRVDRDFDDVVFRRTNSKDNDLKNYYIKYVEFGFYFEQVKRYLDIFGERKVKILLSEDLRRDTQGILKSIFEILGVDNSANVDVDVKINQFKLPKNFLKYFYNNYYLRFFINKILPYSLKDMLTNVLFNTEKPKMKRETEEYLRNLYREDILRLQDLINRDLTHWLRLE